MLTIQYTGTLNEDLDNGIKAVANCRGYEFCSSGYNFLTNTRDLRFIEKTDEVNNG